MAKKHSKQFYKSELNSETIFVLAMESARALDWKVSALHENGFTAYSNFSENSWDESINIEIFGTQINVESRSKRKDSTDDQVNINNTEQFVETLEKLDGSFSVEEITTKYSKFKEHISPRKKPEVEEKRSFKEKRKDFITLFTPSEGYFITPILLYINLAVFLIMVGSGVHFLDPSSESLLSWGANFRPSTLDGEWWRLITACFLHIGIFHLLMNMYALVYIGAILEPKIGKVRFSVTYLLTGISGSALSLFWHELTVSAGASGAIFGMYGMFLAMLTTNLIEKSARKELLTSIGLFVAYNLLYGMQGGVDNAGHIGGLMGGLIIGYVMYQSISNPLNSKLNKITISVATVLILGGSFILVRNTEGKDLGLYQKKMDAFVLMEEKALGMYSMAENSTSEELLSEIEDVSLPNWRGSILMLEELDELDLPENVKDRNAIFIQYCELRIESCQLIKKAIEEQTDKYDDDISKIIERIDATISALEE